MRAFFLFIILLIQGPVLQAREARLDRPVLLLEKALSLETMADPQKIITSYEEILDHPQTGPRTRAQTHYFLAELYESLDQLLSARLHFLGVENHLTSIPGLKETCHFSLQEITIQITEDGCESISAHEHHFMCDLFLSLEGALLQNEKERALQLTERLTALLLEIESDRATADGKLLSNVHKSVVRLTNEVKENALKEASARLAMPGEIRIFFNPSRFADEDEVFSPALIQLSALSRALNTNDANQATAMANAIKAYLSPMLSLSPEHGDEQQFAKRLTDLATGVIVQAAAGDFKKARRQFDDFSLQLYQEGGHPHFHLGHDLTETLLDSSLYPQVSVIMDHLARAANAAAGKDAEGTEKALEQALAGSSKIFTERSGSPDESVFEDFKDSIDVMLKEVRAKGPRVLKRLLDWEVEENDEESLNRQKKSDD